MQGHIRQRSRHSWEYIAHIGMAAAERCSDRGKRPACAEVKHLVFAGRRRS